MKQKTLLLLWCLFCAPLFAQGSDRTANGELELRAYQKSYPDKISAVIFTENDWTIIAGGKVFYWAGGRMLPAEDKDKIDAYSSHFFYRIPDSVAAPESYPPQYIESLRKRGTSTARRERKDSHRGFQGMLYGGTTRTEIENMLARIDFLGSKITVHRIITEPLKRVEAEIRKWAGAENFIASLGSVQGYNWREISGTQRMSFHSWGVAVDIQPKRLGGKAIYWLWERERNIDDWMLVPLEKRWTPPNEVIAIFEKEGFVWGGKWSVYDNMHFEYRPELHEYTRLLSADSSDDPAETTKSVGQVLHHIYPDLRLPQEH